MEFITNTNNLILFAMMLVSGAMLFAPALPGLIHGNASLTPAAATLLINRSKASIIDIRPSADFKTGHLARSKNIPAEQLTTGVSQLALDKTVPIILICGTGKSSTAMISKVKKLGHEDVVSLEGGIAAWNLAGLPLVRNAS